VQAITIGTAEGVEELRARLDDEFRFLHDEGIDIQIGTSSRGRFTFLDCSIDRKKGGPPDEELETLVRHYVANALSDVIVEKLEKDLIRKIIRSSYYYFSRDEQETISAHAHRNLHLPGEAGERSLLYKVSRKSKILHRLRDFLDQSNELVVEGFVTFRLRDYLDELEDAVDRAVDDFLMEREHKEFVRLLRYFVDVQEPRMEQVHVMMKEGGSFKLVDREGVAIRSEYLEEFVVEMVESEVNYEDLLISALITLAPRLISIHGSVSAEWDESVETIKGVFGERVSLCAGCLLCEGVQLAERSEAGEE
jgi:putative sporulation protein YtxC